VTLLLSHESISNLISSLRDLKHLIVDRLFDIFSSKIFYKRQFTVAAAVVVVVVVDVIVVERFIDIH